VHGVWLICDYGKKGAACSDSIILSTPRPAPVCARDQAGWVHCEEKSIGVPLKHSLDKKIHPINEGKLFVVAEDTLWWKQEPNQFGYRCVQWWWWWWRWGWGWWWWWWWWWRRKRWNDRPRRCSKSCLPLLSARRSSVLFPTPPQSRHSAENTDLDALQGLSSYTQARLCYSNRGIANSTPIGPPFDVESGGADFCNYACLESAEPCVAFTYSFTDDTTGEGTCQLISDFGDADTNISTGTNFYVMDETRPCPPIELDDGRR
jgi:hypothetical protein